MDFASSPALPAIGAVISGRAPVLSMSYHEEGTHLFVASDADSRLAIINCMTGKAEQAAIKCERERIHLVTATGHADEVTALSVSPADDTFLSSSKDRTVRLWNMQEAGSLAQLDLPSSASGNPHAVFDSTGLVFAVSAAVSGGKGQYVHLYDARQYGAGGFAELQVHEDAVEEAIQTHTNVSPDRAKHLSRGKWKSIDFNSSGNQLIVGTEHGMVLVLDGFEATVQRVFCPTGKSDRPAGCCFTPDDKTVLAGNTNGEITCYSVETGAAQKTITGHTGPIGCIASNPVYSQFASCCSNTALWTW